MADCLPFPVVCIQCGRGVGLCGVKIIGAYISPSPFLSFPSRPLQFRLASFRANPNPGHCVNLITLHRPLYHTSPQTLHHPNDKNGSESLTNSTGPTIGFCCAVLSILICWPIALIFCCFTEKGKEWFWKPCQINAKVSDVFPI
ncbi:hypothetical protein F5Y15DRAFT_400824 [Xylariaceae sp. FL0016]|nr:hypothetical protein F5Y15DRAFT_400824 [Xylariaceae sp. FL0016]